MPDAKLRVEVRERLVEQERLRLPHDRAAHRHALALAARELRGLPLEQLGEPEQLGDLGDAASDLGLVGTARLQPVAEVLAHGHVWVEGVGLEDHGDVAILRREVGDVALADRDLPVGHLLETRDHPQERRFPASRRADEDEELAVGDLERYAVDGGHPAEGLAHVFEEDRSHRSSGWYRPERSETRVCRTGIDQMGAASVDSRS